MKYSYEYKKNCIELYRQGKWPETPDGIKQENFRISVRRWSRREKSCGTESLQKNQKKMWSADEKYELIAKVLAIIICMSVNSSSWQNYLLMQLAAIALSIVDVVLHFKGYFHHIVLAWIALGLSVLLWSGTMLIGNLISKRTSGSTGQCLYFYGVERCSSETVRQRMN